MLKIICHVYCPIAVQLGIRDVHVMLLNIFEYRENCDRTFLMGVNEITFNQVQ
jgi:hypothetical protein